MDDKEIKTIEEAVKLLYTVTRMANVSANDHDRCSQAANTIISLIQEKEDKKEE